VTDLSVADLLVGADAEVRPEECLASMLARAATAGELDLQTVFVRPRDTFGVRLSARAHQPRPSAFCDPVSQLGPCGQRDTAVPEGRGGACLPTDRWPGIEC